MYTREPCITTRRICCREHSVCELHQQWVADGLPLLLDGRFVAGAGIVLALLQVKPNWNALCESFHMNTMASVSQSSAHGGTLYNTHKSHTF